MDELTSGIYGKTAQHQTEQETKNTILMAASILETTSSNPNAMTTQAMVYILI